MCVLCVFLKRIDRASRLANTKTSVVRSNKRRWLSNQNSAREISVRDRVSGIKAIKGNTLSRLNMNGSSFFLPSGLICPGAPVYFPTSLCVSQTLMKPLTLLPSLCAHLKYPLLFFVCVCTGVCVFSGSTSTALIGWPIQRRQSLGAKNCTFKMLLIGTPQAVPERDYPEVWELWVNANTLEGNTPSTRSTISSSALFE